MNRLWRRMNAAIDRFGCLMVGHRPDASIICLDCGTLFPHPERAKEVLIRVSASFKEFGLKAAEAVESLKRMAAGFPALMTQERAMEVAGVKADGYLERRNRTYDPRRDSGVLALRSSAWDQRRADTSD